MSQSYDARWTRFVRLWRNIGRAMYDASRKHHTWCHCGEEDCAGS